MSGHHKIWVKVQLIRGNKAVFHAVPQTFHGKAVASAMKMAIKATSNTVLPEKVQYFGALIALILRRIVKENQLFLLPCCLQRRFQPAKLPAEGASFFVFAEMSQVL